MFRKSINIVLIAILFNLYIIKAIAHPHVFITYKINFVFEEKKFSGFKINWLFDDVNSTLMFEDFDEDKDGKLSIDEMKELKTRTLDNMKEYDYFTYVKINGKSFNFPPLKDFKINILKNQMISFDFFIPCNIVSKKSEQKINILLKDKSNYIDFAPSKNPLSFKESKKIIYNTNDSNFNENSDNKELNFTFKDK